MAGPNNLIFFICVIVFSFTFSNTVEHDKKDDCLNDVKSKEDALDQRRKAMDYINSLSPNPKTWVDPYDMGLPAKESQEESAKTTDKRPDISSTYPILEEDDQPLFSDIHGNVIVEKVPITPRRNVVNDLDAGGFFPKDPQQICVMDSIYISRWLKKLIVKVENDPNLEASAVSFQLDSVILNTLKEISDAKSLKITELDILICDMLSQMVVATRSKAYDWTPLKNSCTDAVWVIVYMMSVSFVVCAIRYAFKRHPKLMLFFCGFVVFVLWHWMCLCQHIKVYNHAELSSTHIPDECQKHNFKLFEHVQYYITSYFVNNECDKYFERFMINPFFEISFNVTVREAIEAILFVPFSSSQFNCEITQLNDSCATYTLSFMVMLIFMMIMLYLYGTKQFHRGAFLLISKIFKTPQSTCIKSTLNSDDYVNPSDSLKGQNLSFNSNSFSFGNIDNDSIQSNMPENFSGPEFFCDSCDAHDQSGSEDDNSYTYSDNSSWSDNSFDSQNCPGCIHDHDLIQELHVGCRMCANNNLRVAGSAGASGDDLESLSKNDSADFTDQQGNESLFVEETVHTEGGEDPPQPMIDPSAG